MDSKSPESPPVSVPPTARPPHRISRRATLIGALVALLVVGGVGWLAWHLTHRDTAAPAGPFGPGGGRPGGARGGTTVGVAAAAQSDIPVTLEALGTVTPQATVRVRAQVSGILQQVLFKEGQTVSKGQLLAVIDPRPFELALQQAGGQRQRDEAQLEAARVTLQRYNTLLAQDSIARQDVDTQAALVKQLAAAAQISRASEGTARLNLDYTRITAPIAGRVGLRTVDVGNLVSSGDTNGVVLITQVSPIDVAFSVPQDMAATLQHSAGAALPVKVLDRTRSVVLATGTFAALDNQIDVQTGTVKAKAKFGNANLALFPSQFVNVQIQLKTVEGAVVVPVSAVRTGANGDYVFVLKEDRTVTLRSVTRGQATVDKVQITSGLQMGERVITEGADRLREGSRVQLQGDAPGAGGRSGARRPGGAAGAQPAASAAAGGPTRDASPAGARVPAAAGPSSPRPSGSAAGAAPAAAAPAGVPLPTAEQRKRMLDAVRDEPEQLERRRRFLEALDRGEPAALDRWQQMVERRRAAAGQGGAAQ
ncbi:MAG: efflux RND transporter periplasmic adaptor subunit [Ramlibacter sp.]|nr:efflux RND transporter periplasmic adaptor subunit [Ramlibacter sp.]